MSHCFAHFYTKHLQFFTINSRKLNGIALFYHRRVCMMYLSHARLLPHWVFNIHNIYVSFFFCFYTGRLKILHYFLNFRLQNGRILNGIALFNHHRVYIMDLSHNKKLPQSHFYSLCIYVSVFCLFSLRKSYNFPLFIKY